MEATRLRFDKVSPKETLVYISYAAGVVVDELCVGRIVQNRRKVWTVAVKTVDDSWEDTGYYGSYDQCLRFVNDDVYDVFGVRDN